MGNSKHNDLQYVESLLKQAQEAERRSTEEALEIANQALVLAEKNGYKESIAKSYMRIGRCYWITSDFDKAVTYLNQAVELATRIEHHETKAEALIGLGNVYITMEIIDQAITNYNNALNLVQEKGLDEQESKLLNNLGTLHEDLKNYDAALDYYQRSYQKAEESKDEYGKAIAHLNIGNVYLEIDELELSYKHIVSAYQHGLENERTLLLAHSYYSFGQYYQKLKNYQRSIEQLKFGIKSAEESKDFYILVRIYLELANAYDKNNDTEEAKKHFEEAVNLAQQMNSVEFMPKVHEKLALFYERHKYKDDAYTHYKAYFDSSKIIQENRRKERIKNIEFQTKLKDAIQETETYRLLSSELRKNYHQMQVLSDIGRSMTATHDISVIFEQLYDNINRLMVVDTLVLGLHNEVKNTLDFDLYIENNVRQDTFSLDLNNQKSLSVYSFLNQETIKMNDVEKEYKDYIQGVSSSRGTLMLSAMYAPLIDEGIPIGIVSIQAQNRNTYTDTHKVLLETLASYLTIAIKNARYTKELAKLNKKLKALSEQDGLTGIPNRRMFNEMSATLWENAKAEESMLSMLFIDIDNFKDFNDTYGHLTGDEIVISVAQYLQENKADDYFVARYGGDEFVMLLPNTSLEEAKKYSNHLKHSISEIKETDQFKGRVTVSIGLGAALPNGDMKLEEFLDFVDQQLYESKNQGKNKVTAMQYGPTIKN